MILVRAWGDENQFLGVLWVSEFVELWGNGMTRELNSANIVMVMGQDALVISQVKTSILLMQVDLRGQNLSHAVIVLMVTIPIVMVVKESKWSFHVKRRISSCRGGKLVPVFCRDVGISSKD